MRRLSISLLILLALALTAVPTRAGRTLSDPLEGKYKIKVDPDEEGHKKGEKEFDDTFVFKADKCWSETLKKKGFADAVYDEDSRRFGPVAFKAESKSDKEGTAKWSGTITATAIEGELVWTKKDGTEIHYSYKGEKSN
jgi:hypothetical protein